MARRIVICGSTGSIGVQALDVIGRSSELEVVGLSAHASSQRLFEQAAACGVRRVALTGPQPVGASHGADVEVLAGRDGLARLIAESGADMVLNAVVGSAGLGPTIVALSEGIDVALANKESLVVAGELVTALAEGTRARLLPVDSEHSAIFQLVREQPAGTVERLVLTASGGPFRGRSEQQLESVGVSDALAHPTWDMGGKITVDSATLMNKGLEMIEAHHLFAVPYERIDVVVHPQSIVHSLIDLNDGASLAHLGYPDMRVPISYALHFPQRHDVPVERLDLAAIGKLEFEPPDEQTFRCLALAREAGKTGGIVPCVLNAANEVAVQAFLNHQLTFLAIPEVIERTLDTIGYADAFSFEDLYRADGEARSVASAAIQGMVQA